MNDSKRNLRTAGWYTTATRWTQLTLAEDDPVKFDPAFWIDVFQRTQSNAACLSAGGYIAYYPSKVPLHYVSKHIGDSDPFGQLVKGARSLDMHVMARVDPHAVHQDAADAHPEWIAHDQEGRPRRHWAYPEVWVTCAYSDYNKTFMTEVVKEITREYDIDAVFANRWQGHGVCYCANCRQRFLESSGYDLPLVSNAADPVWRAWTAWRRQILTNTVVEWDDAVRSIKPHASFIPNMGSASLMEFDLSLIEKHCPFLVVDDQGRQGIEPIWKAGRNGKRMRATYRERPVILITSIGPEEEYRWKDSVTSSAEIQAWICNGAIHGMRPWFTKFNGVVPDDRWVKPVTDAYALHKQLEPILSSMKPVADIAIIDANTTLRHWASNKRHEAEVDELGFYQALVEARLPFEFLSDQMMTESSLALFKVVILPAARCLSDSQCAMLTQYVENGGRIVAAADTSLCDEDGAERDELGLADLFGVSKSEDWCGPVKNSYIALHGDHPINQGFAGARRIIGGTKRLGIQLRNSVMQPFLRVPDYPDLPMEEVYPREEPSEPAVIAREVPDGGRVVYFPWNVGGVFWEVLATDHQRLIANAVSWALGERSRVEIAGQSVLDVALRESSDQLAVLMFNLTNPMMLKGPIRESYPVGSHQVSVALPNNRTVKSAHLLVAGTELSVHIDQQRAVVDVPEIDVQEVVCFEWQ